MTSASSHTERKVRRYEGYGNCSPTYATTLHNKFSSQHKQTESGVQNKQANPRHTTVDVTTEEHPSNSQDFIKFVSLQSATREHESQKEPEQQQYTATKQPQENTHLLSLTLIPTSLQLTTALPNPCSTMPDTSSDP